MNAARKTHYDELGAAVASSQPELRKSYLALARKYHPDFHANDDKNARDRAAARMRKINEAWAVLGDPVERERYDRTIGAQSNGTGMNGTGAAAASSSAHRAAPDVEPSSGYRPSKLLQVTPALLLASALALFSVGFVTGLIGVLAAGMACALLGGAAFIFVPIFAASKAARNE